VIDQFVSSTTPADLLGCLSSRERQVLQLLAEGRNTGEIAAALSLSPKTVETYRARMKEKLGITTWRVSSGSRSSRVLRRSTET
jgi:two-component system, NarL family, response regulator NreC